MGRRRGFLAELQHQARVAEKQQRAAEREYQAATRRSEQALLAAIRAQAAFNRATEADRKRLEREAAAAYSAAKQAEVEALNLALVEQYEELDGLLSATLGVDDFVDLETLRVVVEHPAFEHEALRQQTPPPVFIPDPEPPVRAKVPEPTGLFGRKKKLAEAQAAVEAQYAADYKRWQAQMAELRSLREAQAEQYAAEEMARQEELSNELAKYERECADREISGREQNAALDDLISGLGYGTVEAVQEYVSIVLANSVYPDSCPVHHMAEFEPSTAELRLQVMVPSPDRIPTIKAYKYVKASDEIASTPLSQKDIRDRYAGIVYGVALRSLHEVFEADRRGLIRAVSLDLGTKAINPATGREQYVPLVAVATTREAFGQIDLSAVVPLATLEHFGAAVSKNPHGLVPANGRGVRRI